MAGAFSSALRMRVGRGGGKVGAGARRGSFGEVERETHLNPTFGDPDGMGLRF